MKLEVIGHIEENQSERDRRYYGDLGTFFTQSAGSVVEKLHNWPLYAPRADISRFLAKAEIFQKVLEVPGHIIECGVHRGGGLLTWAQLSSIFEPLSHTRRIVGFDTFSGFPSVSERDGRYSRVQVGEMAVPEAPNDLQEAIRLYDLGRPISHIPRVELVVGDALQTMPEYVEQNQHLLVALLYLDFDLYDATVAAIETFRPRMPRGAVIAFDQLGLKQWPGETRAVLDALGITNLNIRRFPWQPQLTYTILE
jgi:hypothetical protein